MRNFKGYFSAPGGPPAPARPAGEGQLALAYKAFNNNRLGNSKNGVKNDQW